MILSYKLRYNIHWGIPEKWERLIFTWSKQVFTRVTNNDGKICKENLWRGNTELKLTKFHLCNTDTSSVLKWQRDSVYAMWKRKREEKKPNQNNKKQPPNQNNPQPSSFKITLQFQHRLASATDY